MTHHSRTRDRSNSAQSEEAIESLQTAAIHFYDLRPPRIVESLLCFQATLALSPPQRTHARVLLQTSFLLYNYCNNSKEVCAYLEQCRVLCQSLGNIDQVKLPCLHLLAKVYLNAGNIQGAKQVNMRQYILICKVVYSCVFQVLKAAREETEENVFWHSTYLFQLANLYRHSGDLISFHATLTRGVKYCEKNSAPAAQLYFMLMQFLQYNREFKYKEASVISTDLFSRLEKFDHPSCTILKASHHTISLLSALQLGKILTYKGQLKELQVFAREISHSNIAESETREPTPIQDNFIWIQRDNLFQLVYLISMLHPMLSGATDRAIGYADKALRLISQQTDILLAQPWDGLSGDNIPKTLADQFKTLVLHNLCVCYIVKGSLSEVPLLLQQTSLLHARPIDPLAHHMLTGLYLFGQDRYKLALSHFQLALDTPKSQTADIFLQIQALIHMCICYVKLGSQHYDSDVMMQVMGKLKLLRNNNLPSEALNLNAATNFVIGLHQALMQSLPEAKGALKEAVVLANTEDLHKLVACTLILLGKVFMAIGKKEEAGTMIPPAFQLANKIQDADLQIWAATLMAEHLQSAGDEASQRETLSARQQKLAIRELELQQVQGVEDGSISMSLWVDEGDRLVGSQDEMLKSPRSPDPKRVRMGHPLTPKTEKENKTNHFIVKPEMKETKQVARTDYTEPDKIPKQEITNNHETQFTQLNNSIENTDHYEVKPDTFHSSENDTTSIYNQRTNYTAIPRVEHKHTINGNSHYKNYIDTPQYIPPAYQHTTPTVMSPENPLNQSPCLSHDNSMYQETMSINTQRPYYQQQATNSPHYQQVAAVYPQVMSQHNSPLYNSQTRGVRLLEQGEWPGDENKIPVSYHQLSTPVTPTLQEGQAAHYQHLLQQQLIRQTTLGRRQSSDVVTHSPRATPDPTQGMQVPLEALTNRYGNRLNNIGDLSAPNVSLDSFQPRQVTSDTMPDRMNQGYSAQNMLEQTQLRQSAFEMQPNMDSRLPSINPIQSRQPFKLQSLLQSSPMVASAPDKQPQSNSHLKRPRMSPTSSQVIDPLTIPISSYTSMKPPAIPAIPPQLMPHLMLQTYPQSHAQQSPCRQQQGVQLNPALQNHYSKNMSHTFGEYFMPRPPYLFPPGSIYPPTQYQTIDPARFQMHPQSREK